ncbi:hypothetical protein CR155_10935 [Pollutimonas nitritireducens]|uniref:Uncharacterized protein n=1 Tax=Pollutimonas nitritireducens TaxID=2045209 RepID=A0A2N4UG03_9BURK|nr:hypothetical protein [Pollutimonas nitritireducens]PLC53939.1 hypothetical protein CR155_10935 [Pollutimonas nitritireducens]
MHSTIDTRMLDIAQQAAQYGIGAMSLGEALTAALVLDRSDWLHERGYSIAEALDRIGPDWAARLSNVARRFHTEATQATRRFSFEIIPRHSEIGGYTLRLLDGGREVGGGQLSAQGKSVRFADEQSAYDEALAVGCSWLAGKQTEVFPELSH